MWYYLIVDFRNVRKLTFHYLDGFFCNTFCFYFSVLMQAGVDVNGQDFDGWTPLHAAAHWGQREACEILVENFCDMDRKNLVVRIS